MEKSSQLKIVESLDALLILGGEEKSHSRTNHTYQLYSGIQRKTPLPIILSGSHSGLSRIKPEKPEAERMKEYLLGLGIPEGVMRTEIESLDTLGNVIFSRPIIDQLLSASPTKKIGVVTDKFHINRGLWAVKRVFPRNYTVEPLPTEKETSLVGQVVEIAIKNAWRYDLWRERIEPGDQEAFLGYIAEKHPMHVHNAPLGAYKAGIYFLNLLRK